MDDASTNDRIKNILKERSNSSNILICNGEFFHVRCCAHILNLIVQEGLKATGDVMHKIRESIRYVKQSEVRMINFKRYVEETGDIIDTSLDLKLDVSTKWNSPHAMLEDALRYHRAFAILAFHDSHYHHCLTNEEWSRVNEMCTFLKPFAMIIELISESSYPISNMYFMLISKIEFHLKEYVLNDNPVFGDMAATMLGKLDKYWIDYNVILTLAVILDPRMKFDIIKFSYSRLDPMNCSEKIENIRSKLYYVFNDYKDVGLSSSFVGVESSSNVNVSKTLPNSINYQDSYWIAFADYLKYKRKDAAIMEKSELDYYLEEGLFRRRNA